MPRHAVLVLVVAALAAGCGGDGGGEAVPSTGFNAERAYADLVAQVEIGPRPAGSPASRRTARLIAGRLRDAGATAVAIQGPHRNVVGHLPGAPRAGAVVVGAHHDTVGGVSPDFEGANDGASGVAVVLELARVLEPAADGPAIHFALFDAEEARGDRPFTEDGMRGSRQYVRYARRGAEGSPPLDEIRAMVLFDMVGDCDLAVPREGNSDAGLFARFADAARELSGDGSPAPFEGEAAPILDDHVPFLEAGVPAVNLIDFEYGPGPSPGEWWHAPADTLERVCAESLAAVGAPAELALPAIR